MTFTHASATSPEMIVSKPSCLAPIAVRAAFEMNYQLKQQNCRLKDHFHIFFLTLKKPANGKLYCEISSV